MSQAQTNQLPNRRRGGRPRLSEDERRSYRIKIGFTPSQYQTLVERSEAAGLSDVELIRRLAINQQFHTVPSINKSALIELNKIGVNLNQLTKIANSTFDSNFLHSLDEVKAEIKTIAKKLYD